MPSTTSFQSQQQAVDPQRHRSPPPPQPSSADQIPHPYHPTHQQAQHHHQQSYATTSTPQQYASYYASHHHQHSALVDHPTDGTPLHDPQQQSLRQEQHPLVDSEGLAAAELLAAFPQSEAVDASSSPSVSSLPQAAAAALSAQEAASADASHSLHHPSAAQAIALPFPPPGSVPIAYFAGPNGSIIAIPQLKAKRRQVKNACTNCQKACKKCDEVRPCTRCVKYGIDKDCVDSQRKERKKGIKRGPYKKREPKIDLEEEDPTLPQGSGNLAPTHILTPDNAAAFQLGGTVIYSYTPAMVQPSGSPSAASSPGSNLPQSPTHQPQASSSTSPSSSAQHHIQIQPAMLPAQMQFQKAPDGSLQYPPQYYIATQPVVSASGSGMEENANGEGSSSAGSSAQQVQIQQHSFPLQYFGQMAYAGFPAGYVVQQPGSIYQIAPSSMQSTSSHHQHQHHSAASNDDPIERQNQHQHQGPLPPTLNSSPNGGKGKGKSIESRKKVAAATLAAAQQEMERSRAGRGGGPE